jgi:short-subunit dehydrogenase
VRTPRAPQGFPRLDLTEPRTAVLITGPTVKGLGFEAARAIATQKPALLILAGRNIDALNEAEGQIKKETPDANIRKLILDLGSLKQVRKAAQEALSYPEPNIDVVINNAGIVSSTVASERRTSQGQRPAVPDGFAEQD